MNLWRYSIISGKSCDYCFFGRQARRSRTFSIRLPKNTWLDTFGDDDFHRAYTGMPEELRGPGHGPEEESYALESLADLRSFYLEAAAERRHVIFTTYG